MSGNGERDKDMLEGGAKSHRGVLRDNSLVASLNSYKDLDDYEYYRSHMIKKSVMRKYDHIMLTIKAKYKEINPQADDDDFDNDSDTMEEPNSEFPKFNRILKRHKKRLSESLNQPRPHHR